MAICNFEVGDPVHRVDLDPNKETPDDAFGKVEAVLPGKIKVCGGWYPCREYTYDFDSAWERYYNEYLAEAEKKPLLAGDPPLEDDLDSIFHEFPDARSGIIDRETDD